MVRWCFALAIVLVAASLAAPSAHAALTSYQVDSFFDIYIMGNPCHYTGGGTGLIWTDVALPPPGGSGTISAELLSMNLNLTGPLGPMMVRESPLLHSLGEFDYTGGGGGGGGGYQIDSFFDVFFEISLDDGMTWAPTSGPGQYSGQCDSFFDVFVELELPVDVPAWGPVTDSSVHFTPEPGSILALASGLLGLAALKLRRK
jgi:hypothetical protein